MIYFQSLLVLFIAYLIVANYLKHDNLLDIEGFFDKLFGKNKKEILNSSVHNFHFAQPETIEHPVIDNPVFNNSPWAWAVPFDYEYPRRDVFECIDNRLEASSFNDRMACPICKTPSENLLWIKFKSPPSTWANLCGTEGPMSLCENCYIEVDYIETARN